MKITTRKYAQALAQMVDGENKAIIKNFLDMLRRRKQTKLLNKIMKQFEKEWYKLHDIVQLEVSYPKKFESSLAEFEKNMETKFHGKVKITAIPSDELTGGLKMKIDDTLIDGTLEGRLRTLAKNLNNSGKQL